MLRRRQKHCAGHASVGARARQGAQEHQQAAAAASLGGEGQKSQRVRLSRRLRWGGGAIEAEVVGMLVDTSAAGQPDGQEIGECTGSLGRGRAGSSHAAAEKKTDKY
jgi:hypothetical protein